MFPEFRDVISQLKGHDAHFTRLFDKHNELDQLTVRSPPSGRRCQSRST